jgi:hypothetical protein
MYSDIFMSIMFYFSLTTFKCIVRIEPLSIKQINFLILSKREMLYPQKQIHKIRHKITCQRVNAELERRTTYHFVNHFVDIFLWVCHSYQKYIFSTHQTHLYILYVSWDWRELLVTNLHWILYKMYILVTFKLIRFNVSYKTYCNWWI